MPMDPHAWDESDENERERGRRFKEFECPECYANNPYDDGFTEGDEVHCFYCGVGFRVELTPSGRLHLVEL